MRVLSAAERGGGDGDGRFTRASAIFAFRGRRENTTTAEVIHLKFCEKQTGLCRFDIRLQMIN